MAKEIYNVTWPGWEVVRRIGSGSFGTVYEIQRDVYGDIEKAALKVISIPRSEDEVDYLRCTGLNDASITQTFHQQVGDIAKEYKLMAQMRDNPNIVRCDDFRDIQHDDGLGWDIYIKMELLTPLMKCLDKVVTEAEIIQLGKDICNALIVCQEKNIIHRDIKPQNVFVSEKGQFKLGDFGIARTIERTTHATAGIGTYSYMAPEVKNNESYGKAADIYSLGLMMYWLLNERRGPFMPLPPAVPKYDDEEKARQRRFSGEQLPPPKHGSEELKSVVLKACAYDPEKRYQTAEEMMAALNTLQGDQTAAAVEPEFIKLEATEDIDGTIGPWKAMGGEMPNADEEEIGTVGPAFNARKTDIEDANRGDSHERAAKPVLTEGDEIEKKQKEHVTEGKQTKKKRTMPIIAGVVVGFVLLLLLLKSCGEGEPEPTFPPFAAPSTSTTTSLPDSTTVPTTVPDSTTVPTTVPDSTTVPTTVPDSTTVPTTVPDSTMADVLGLKYQDLTLEWGQTANLYRGNIDPAEITWLSSDEKVATVKNGIVAPVGNGVAIITATYQGQTCTCIVRVPMISVTDFYVDDAQEGVLVLHWKCSKVIAPEEWVVLYSVDNSLMYVEHVLESGICTIPRVPGANYAITLQTTGKTPFSGVQLNYKAPDATDFNDYGLKASDMELKMCVAPNSENWDYKDVVDWRNKFSVGEKAAIVIGLHKEYLSSSDTIDVLYVIRDQAGNVVSFISNAQTWTSMWYRGYGEFEIPNMPTVPGNYSISIYFKIYNTFFKIFQFFK